MSLFGFDITAIALIVAAVIAGLIVLSVFGRVLRLYRRVPPNKALVIFGRGRTVFEKEGERSVPRKLGVRIVTGGGTFVIPILEEAFELNLNVMTISIDGDEVYTTDGVPISLDWVSQVQHDSTEEALLTAARAFGGKVQEDIKEVITQTLSTNFRAIVGQLTVEEVHRDRDAFVQKVQKLASEEMAALGTRVISMGVKQITDKKGYFEAMATGKIAEVKKTATIAQAVADREARVQAAEAQRAAQQAELDAQRAILEQKQALELRDVERAQAVGLAQAESERKVQEVKALAVAKQQEAEVLVPARAKRDAIEIEAEASRKKITIEADARASATRQTAQAEADAAKALGEGNAAAKRAELTAEADGTKAKLLAEAEGKQKLAEAVAAEGEINLRQLIAQLSIEAGVKRAEAIALALGAIGANVRVVQFAGSDGTGANGNALLEILKSVPEIASVLDAKADALTGKTIPQIVEYIKNLLGQPGSAKPEAEGSRKSK